MWYVALTTSDILCYRFDTVQILIYKNNRNKSCILYLVLHPYSASNVDEASSAHEQAVGKVDGYGYKMTLFVMLVGYAEWIEALLSQFFTDFNMIAKIQHQAIFVDNNYNNDNTTDYFTPSTKIDNLMFGVQLTDTSTRRNVGKLYTEQ